MGGEAFVFCLYTIHLVELIEILHGPELLGQSWMATHTPALLMRFPSCLSVVRTQGVVKVERTNERGIEVMAQAMMKRSEMLEMSVP